jgi:hypothetical protein
VGVDVHVLLPLDGSHEAALRRLAAGAALAAGLGPDLGSAGHHVSLVVVPGATLERVRLAMAEVAHAVEPLSIRAHGYGFFTDGTTPGTSLHVPVVSGPALLELHRRACVVLGAHGMAPAAWTAPERWSPHITLLDHGLDPVALGHAVTWLGGRHHPHWSIPIDRLAVEGRQGDPAVEPATVVLGARARGRRP